MNDTFEKVRQMMKDLGFSVRIANCLEQEGIDSLKALCNKRPSELLVIRNFGAKSLRELREALAKKDLYLKGEGKLRVYVVWGTDEAVASLGNEAIRKYEFDTEKERAAFVLGVKEGYGHSEHALFDTRQEAEARVAMVMP